VGNLFPENRAWSRLEVYPAACGHAIVACLTFAGAVGIIESNALSHRDDED
jgi:hypothetical protein